MGITLDPSSYPCPDHTNVDLTEEVRGELGPSSVVIGLAVPGRSSKKAKQKQFAVKVRCPGAGTAHDVYFSGTYSE
jgi:hypothetical protein